MHTQYFLTAIALLDNMTIVVNGRIENGRLILNDPAAFQALTKQLPEGASVTLELSEGESYGQTLMQYYKYVVKPYLLLVFVSQLKVPSEVLAEIDIDAFMRIEFGENERKYIPKATGYESITIPIPISPENIESLLTKLNAWLKELGLKLPKRNPDTYQR
jgi:hypothetical protein